MTDSGHRADGWDYALMLGGTLGLFLALAFSLGLAGLALTGLIRGSDEAALAGEWTALATLIMGLLCLPAIYFGGASVFGRDVGAIGRPDTRWLYLALLFPIAMFTGSLAYERGILAGILGPVSHLLAAGLPVLAAVVMIRRLGPAIPERRAWGQFLAGLWITPAGALTLELLTLVPTGAALVIGLRSSIDFSSLGQLMVRPDPLNSPEYVDLLRHLILQPWVIVVVLSYIAVVVPIIEEGLKSIAVWPFLMKGLTPAEAFLGGTLAGAGYAMFEALYLTQPGQGWVETMLARVGATFVHVLTAGLSSWGLMQGFYGRKWGRCIAAAFAAIVIHGVWNASAVGIGISLVAEQAEVAGGGIWSLVGNAGALLLAVLGVLALVAPALISRRLARTASRPTSDIAPSP